MEPKFSIQENLYQHYQRMQYPVFDSILNTFDAFREEQSTKALASTSREADLNSEYVFRIFFEYSDRNTF